MEQTGVNRKLEQNYIASLAWVDFKMKQFVYLLMYFSAGIKKLSG